MRERLPAKPKDKRSSTRRATPDHDAIEKDSTTFDKRALGNRGMRRLLGAATDAEREADHAADEVAAGHEVRTERLTSRLAGPRLSLGAGEPIRGEARKRLETAFSVDLAAVRVHRGPEASTAAAHVGATAFASGTDVVLGARAPDPASPQGLELLAHEVAHVVQQVGAVGDDGRVRLVPRHGAGRIQAKELTKAEDSPTTPTIRDLLTRHKAAVTSAKSAGRRSKTDAKRSRDKASTEDLALAETEIEALRVAALGLGGTPAPPPTFWKERAAHVLAGTSDPVFGKSSLDLQLSARAALIDCLKAEGEIPAAVELFALDPFVRTTFHSKRFLEEVLSRKTPTTEQLASAVYLLWADHDLFERSRELDFIYNNYWYLTGPTRSLTKTPLSGDSLTKIADDVSASRFRTAGLIESELTLVVARVVRDLDEARYTALQKARGKGEHAALVKYDTARNVVAWCDDFMKLGSDEERLSHLKHEGDDPVIAFIAKDWLVPVLRSSAMHAVNQWEQAKGAEEALRAGTPLNGSDPAAIQLIYQNEDPFEFYGLQVRNAAELVFARQADDRLPKPIDHAKHVDKARKDLTAWVLDKFETPLFRVLRDAHANNLTKAQREHREKYENRAYFDAVIWGLWAFSLLEAKLLKYKRKDDEDFAKKYAPPSTVDVEPSYRGEDLRHFHRYTFARTLHDLAAQIGWEGTRLLAATVLKATEFLPSDDQQRHNILILPGEWKEDEGAAISVLRNDSVGQIRVRGLEPLSPSDVALFYEAYHNNDVAKHLSYLVESNRTTFDKGAEPLVNQALKDAKGFLRPRRFTMKPYYLLHPLSIDPTDFDRDAAKERRDIQELLDFHPRVVALKQEQEARTIDMVIAHDTRMDAEDPSGGRRITGTDLQDDVLWPLIPANQKDEAVVWTLPVPGLFVRLLQHNRHLNWYVFSELHQATPSDAQLQAQMILPWHDWFLLLRKFFDKELGALTDTSTEEDLKKAKRAQYVRHAAVRRILGLQEPTSLIERMGIALAGDVDRMTFVQEVDAEEERLRGMADPGTTETMRADLEKDRDTTRERLTEQIKISLNHERTRRLKTMWIPALRDFDPSSSVMDLVEGTKNQYQQDVPIRVLSSIQQFAGQVPYPEDRPYHVAMAILALSYLLYRRLSEPRSHWFLIAQEWQYAIRQTLDLVVDGKLPDDPFLSEDEKERRKKLTPAQNRARFAEFFFTPDDPSFVDIPWTWFLEKTEQALATFLIEQQMDTGIVGRDGDGTTSNPGLIFPIVSGSEWSPYGGPSPLHIHGRTWRILRVFEEFKYYPSVVYPYPPEGVDRAGASRLFVRRSGVWEEVPPSQRDDSTVLMMVQIQFGEFPPETYDVTAKTRMPGEGVSILHRLTYDSIMGARVRQLTGLASAMETGAQFLMDAAELIPGAGQALAATRLTTEVLRFIATNDLKDMVLTLAEDPSKLIEGLTEWLSKIADPTWLIDFLIFDGLELKVPKTKPPGRAERFAKGPAGRVRRIIAKLQRMGASFALSLIKLQRLVHAKRDAAQVVAFEHPIIAYGLRQLVYRFYQIAPYLSNASLDQVQEKIDEFTTSMQQIFVSMNELELPAEIITQGDIVGLVAEFIGARLGGKWKVGFQVLLGVLDALGERENLQNKIGEILKGAGINLAPTALWQSFVREDLEPVLRDAHKTFYDKLKEYLALVSIDLPDYAPLTITLVGDDFPESMPAIPNGGLSGLRLDTRPGDFAGGAPLPPTMRMVEELRFGTALGHVRLHQDAAADRLTGSVGALGLTSGSHVFLPRRTRVGTHAGRSVLRHELGHVLTQTGTRRSETPVRGRPGRGLVVDSAQEAKADRIAADADAGRGARPAAHGEPEGFQPFLMDSVVKLLDSLSSFENIDERADAIAETGSSTGRELIDADVRRDVAKVADGIWKLLDVAHIKKHAEKPFSTEAELLSGYLKDRKKDLENDIEDIAIDTSLIIRDSKLPSGYPRQRLAVDRFRAGLANHFWGKLGILIRLELASHGTGNAKKLDASAPVDKVAIRYVHLPKFASGTKIWSKVAEHLPAKMKSTRYRRTLRQILMELGPGPRIWDKSVFKMHDDVIEKLKERVAEGPVLQASELPKTKELYLTHTNPPAATNRDVGVIGMVVSTYGDQKTKGKKHWGKERESHHLPQYLTAEYFNGGVEKKGAITPQSNLDKRAFKILYATTAAERQHRKDAYSPWLKFDGDDPKLIKKPNAAKKIHLSEWEAGRGSKMPAISLARGTHRSSVHVTPKSVDVPTGAAEPTTQGEAINLVFRKFVGDKIFKLEEAAAKNYDAANEAAWKAEWDGEGAAKYYEAIKKTYTWVMDLMEPKLRRAVRSLEVTYYNELAEEAGKTDLLTENEAEKPVDALMKLSRKMPEVDPDALDDRSP